MTDLERLTAMLSANAALRKHCRTIYCGGKEPSSFIMLNNVETDDAVCFAFDKRGKLWNIHIQKPENVGSGASFVNRDGVPVLVATSQIKQGV